MNSDLRLDQAQHWLHELLPAWEAKLSPLAGDASTRRYYRTKLGATSYVLMDAPPANQDCRPFVAIAERFAKLGLTVPTVYHANFEQGFLLLEDLGQCHYLDALTTETADELYRAAIDALLEIQTNADPKSAQIPDYDDELLRRELAIFYDWLLTEQLQVRLTSSQQTDLAVAFDFLCEQALQQPRCWVHRDYHSRNLLVVDRGTPAILDFQDGLYGPISYDLVSLLRDCYIAWPEAAQMQWLDYYYESLQRRQGTPPVTREALRRGFDLCGVQRHLKAAGLFARLALRDNKSSYQADLPRTLGYVVNVSERYPALAGLRAIIIRYADHLLA